MSPRPPQAVLLVLLLALLWPACSQNGGNGHENGKKATALTGEATPTETVEALGDDELVVQEPVLELTKAEQRGLMIFGRYCAHCHGEYGLGDGQNAFGLETPPRDLLQLELNGTRSDEQLHQVIRDGGAAHGFSPLMPPWGHTLQPARIDDLVALIHILPELEPVEDDDGILDFDDEDDMGEFSL